MTTPFEREILSHFACGGTSSTWNSNRCGVLYHQFIKKLTDLGILCYDSRRDEIVGVKPALKVYTEALAEVPLPVQMHLITWQIP